MGIADRLLARVLGEKRAATLAAPPEWLVEALGAGTTSAAGKTVSPKTAMQLVPVFSAVQLLAGSVASLPLIVYHAERRERAQDTRQWALLHDQPNPWMAADELWEIVTAHLCLWGNSFLAKIPDGFNRTIELWPLAPNRCQVTVIDGKKIILVDGLPHTEDEILHIKGLSSSGLVGLSPIQQARQMLGSAIAQDEFAGTFWVNGTMLSGYLTHPQQLSNEATARLRRSWESRYAGVGNSWKTPVLEEGMDWKSAGMPLADAQFVEQAKLADLRVAQLFRIPPYMLGAEIGSSLTYSTTESQGIDFVRWTLTRWLRRIEQSLRRDLDIFPPSHGLYPEFLVDGLLRAETKARYETYEIGIRSHILLPNEAREAENRPPLEGGDEFPALPAPVRLASG